MLDGEERDALQLFFLSTRQLLLMILAWKNVLIDTRHSSSNDQQAPSRYVADNSKMHGVFTPSALGMNESMHSFHSSRSCVGARGAQLRALSGRNKHPQGRSSDTRPLCLERRCEGRLLRPVALTSEELEHAGNISARGSSVQDRL